MGTAGFDRAEDHWPRQLGRGLRRLRRRREAAVAARAWACAGSRSSAGPSAAATSATGHGNSVPRFHITWGTGPGVVAPFVRRVREAARSGLRHAALPPSRRRADQRPAARSTACAARCWSRADVERGVTSSRKVVGEFALKAQAVIVTSGGIGGNIDLVRKNWPEAAGHAAASACCAGVPDHVDGRMLGDRRGAPAAASSTATACGTTPRASRNWTPDLEPTTASASCPGPSSLWLDATGKRLPAPLLPGLRYARHARAHHAQPATTTRGSSSPRRSSRRSSRSRAPSRTRTSPARSMLEVLRARRGGGARRRCEAFKEQGRRLRRRRDAAGAGRAA